MDLDTPTVIEQRELEGEVARIYSALANLPPSERIDALQLQRDMHIKYVSDGLGKLPASFLCLEASRTWIAFWLSHSLALLGEDLELERAGHVVDFLRRCQHPRGGYGGGPGQIPHVAPTYAALACLSTVNHHPDALPSIDREALWDFLTRMILPIERGGGFAVHEGGEADLRACYCSIAAAVLAGLDAKELADRAHLVEYVQRCQTFEGGLGGEPGNEAHGGYTYCGLAALVLVGKADAIDLKRLAHWAVYMQGEFEGGFRGRTNKLVDGCYSFWQGAVFPLLRAAGVDPASLPSTSTSAPSGHAQALLDFPLDSLAGVAPGDRTRLKLRVAIDATDEISPETEARMDDVERLRCASYALFHEVILEDSTDLYNSTALQAWLLACSQMMGRGGMRDKPGKHVDFYHTCYCLSGLAASQGYGGAISARGSGEAEENGVLAATDPRVNVCIKKLNKTMQFWAGLAK